MTRETFIKTLEELIRLNNYIVSHFVEDKNEAKWLRRENAIYREVIQKTENGEVDERLLQLMLNVSDFDQMEYDPDEERYQREAEYDRNGIPIHRRAEVRNEIFALYDEEEWGETDEVFRGETERRQEVTSWNNRRAI